MSLNDELLLNPVLSFVQSAGDSIDEKHMIDLIVGFFEPSAVYASKRVVFELVGKQFKERRVSVASPNTARSDSFDIINLFNELEQEKVKLPMFVSPGYGSIPSGAGIRAVVGVLASLRDEVAHLKYEIKEMKKENENDRKIYEDSSILKEEIADIKKMILIRKDTNHFNMPNGHSSQAVSGDAGSSPSSSPRRKKARGSVSVPSTPRTPTVPSPSNPHPMSFATKLKTGLPLTSKMSTTTGGSVRSKKVFRGIQGSKSHSEDDASIGFRSAPRYSHIYVGGCDKSTTEKHVEKYCQDGEVDTVEIEKLKCKNTERSSFRIKVNLKDKNKVLNSDFWLCGIIVRPYRLSKSSTF